MTSESLRNERGRFSLLDLSHLELMAEALGLEPGVAENNQVIADAMNTLLITGGQQVSGLVLEPDWGLGAYSTWLAKTTLPQAPTLVLRVDTPPTVPTTSTLPTISADWGIEQITNNYGLAFLELRYHPNEAEALAKKQLVSELYDFCQQQQTDLILKLVIQDATATFDPEAQLTAIQELRATAHVLVLEVPSDPLAAATLTAELDIPWMATPTPDQGFPQFQTSLSQALENGAQGYLVGQTAWADLSQLKRADQAADINQVKTFINTTFRERLESLNQVVADAGKA